MSKEIPIIDAHGHLGSSFRAPENTLEDYYNEVPKNVIHSVMSPGPTPIYDRNGDGRLFVPARWRIDEKTGKITYRQQYLEKGSLNILEEDESDDNPYAETNDYWINRIEDQNSRGTKPRIHIMPIHHPRLDTPEEVRRVLGDERVIALKVSGLASATIPEDISPEVVAIIKELNKPIIVHTDHFDGDPKTNLQKIYKANDPRKWVSWAKETGIKTLITHAARLSPEAIHSATGCKNIVFGFGPDLLIMAEQYRLFSRTENLLKDFFELTLPEQSDQVVFDHDYGWNTKNGRDWNDRDWTMSLRTAQTIESLGYGEEMIKKVFFENAARFFDIG